MQADKLRRSVAQAQELIKRFLVRENRGLDLDSPDLLSTPFRGNPAIFAPTQKVNGAWEPPKYSVRRQKLLQQKVELLGLDPSILPASPPRTKRTAADLPEDRRKIVATPHVPETKVLNEIGLEKKGPYVGRKGAAFKGHLWERYMDKKLAERAELLKKAPERKAEFRKTQADVRKKSKPSLPF